jgi:isoquinoline 1-oxidoreductase subunit alpha
VAGEADGASGSGQFQSGGEDERDNAGALRSEGHANGHLLGTHHHREGDDTVDAEDGEQQSDGGKRPPVDAAVVRLAPFEARLATCRIRWPAKISRVVDEGQAMAVALVLNGKRFELDVEPDEPLLWAIREAAGLTGTKYGCGMALCGACTVHLNGRAIRSCVTPVRSVAEKSITTIEGVSGPVAQAVLRSWERIDVAQCGYCQPGQIMSAIALLKQTPVPTDDQIDTAMSGNICRCGTYVRIRAAIHDAASIHKG